VSLPLTGVTVLDLTRELAGPYATMVLGDLGADSSRIKIHDAKVEPALPPAAPRPVVSGWPVPTSGQFHLTSRKLVQVLVQYWYG
jgi:crotonobetainyl-CoA:carnitine CoA-transferase CaiB-like acyl-CoA transferase